jgi:hypothetical protein
MQFSGGLKVVRLYTSILPENYSAMQDFPNNPIYSTFELRKCFDRKTNIMGFLAHHVLAIRLSSNGAYYYMQAAQIEQFR